MTSAQTQTLALLYQAIGSPYGIAVSCPSGVDNAKSTIYIARKGCSDPAVQALTLRTNPLNPDELFVIRQAVPQAALPTGPEPESIEELFGEAETDEKEPARGTS